MRISVVKNFDKYAQNIALEKTKEKISVFYFHHSWFWFLNCFNFENIKFVLIESIKITSFSWHFKRHVKAFVLFYFSLFKWRTQRSICHHYFWVYEMTSSLFQIREKKNVINKTRKKKSMTLFYGQLWHSHEFICVIQFINKYLCMLHSWMVDAARSAQKDYKGFSTSFAIYRC